MKKSIVINLTLIVLIVLCLFLTNSYQITMADSNIPPDTFEAGRVDPDAHASWDNIWGGGSTIKYVLTTGEIVYCWDYPTPWADGTMSKWQEIRDKGLAWIILNGYPHKNPMDGVSGASNTNYDNNAVTQWAIWIYKDRYILGVSDNQDGEVPAADKQEVLNNREPYSTAIRNMVEQAYQVKNSNDSYEIDFSSDITFSASSDGQTFVSSIIGMQPNSNFSEYKVNITAPSGYYVLKDGNKITESALSTTTFTIGEEFQIVIPTTAITKTNLQVTVSLSATASVDEEVVYSYSSSAAAQSSLLARVYTNVVTKQTSQSITLPTGKLKIQKLSSEDLDNTTPLAGATLKIESEDGSYFDTWVTTEEDKVFTDLLPGTKYIVTEISAPAGYIKNKEEKSYTVTTTDCYTSDSNISVIQLINDDIKLTVAKLDLTTTTYVEGATLTITNQEGTASYEKTFTTTGVPILINKIPAGEYTIREVRAPTGYLLPENDLTFTITEDGEITSTSLTEEYEIKNENNIAMLSVYNRQINVLPNTGGSGMLPFFLGGFLLIIVSAFGFLCYRKRRGG